ncbi:MAG: SNARE associated Golgi protein-like protein [Bacteroidetes bacterium]|nr:SNARE associated Golgi protein-like protein [Bacteroidota bacterium]
MEWIREIFQQISAENLVRAGYVIMALVVFAETGLLAGFFLPGDSLLVTAGVFAARGDLDIVFLNVLLMISAIIGDAVGFQIGKRAGKALFDRPDSRFFKQQYLVKTQAFYEKHGGKTIVLARFIPILRTFAPTIAGIAGMGYVKFASFNVCGGILWVLSMTMLGYLLGNFIPNLDKNIDKVIILVVFISVTPILWHFIKPRLFPAKSTPID